jgi:hypothetical protein
LLLFAVILDIDEFTLGRAVAERHILQLALSTGVAYGAVERMVGQNQFEHRFACLPDFITVGRNNHTFADHSSARGLKLGHLFDANETHAARALQRQARIVAEGWNLNADALARLNQQRASRYSQLLAINGYVYVSHEMNL